MAEAFGSTVHKSQVVYDAIVLDYSAGDYAQYLKDKKAYEESMEGFNADEGDIAPEPPEIQDALRGLRIMDVTVSEESKMTRSPVETGVYIADAKVRQPRRISIKGICDNLRGPIITTVDTRHTIDAGVPAVLGGNVINQYANGFMDGVTGFTYATTQQIETRARSVYKKIHEMYTNKERVNGKPKTWAISTKGAVYPNMVLRTVDQLNDWEHLMVIPVTLNFEELMMVGEDESDPVVLSDDDSPLTMEGTLKKGNILEETWGSIKEAFK